MKISEKRVFLKQAENKNDLPFKTSSQRSVRVFWKHSDNKVRVPINMLSRVYAPLFCMVPARFSRAGDSGEISKKKVKPKSKLSNRKSKKK